MGGENTEAFFFLSEFFFPLFLSAELFLSGSLLRDRGSLTGGLIPYPFNLSLAHA